MAILIRVIYSLMKNELEYIVIKMEILHCQYFACNVCACNMTVDAVKQYWTLTATEHATKGNVSWVIKLSPTNIILCFGEWIYLYVWVESTKWDNIANSATKWCHLTTVYTDRAYWSKLGFPFWPASKLGLRAGPSFLLVSCTLTYWLLWISKWQFI